MDFGLILVCLVAYLVFTILYSFMIMGLFLAANVAKKVKDPNTGEEKEDRLILVRPKRWLDKVLGEYWNKIVLGCYRCMPTGWLGIPGTIAFVLLGIFFGPMFFWGILLSWVSVPIVSAMSTLLYSKIRLQEFQGDVNVLVSKQLKAEINDAELLAQKNAYEMSGKPLTQNPTFQQRKQTTFNKNAGKTNL
jgi:hypothetical protein